MSNVSRRDSPSKLMPRSRTPSDEEVLLVTSELDEFEVIRTAMLGVAVPFDAPREFKARILAAAASYLWENKSIDYQLRNHRELYERERPSPEERALFDALVSAKRHVQEFSYKTTRLPKASVNAGCFAAEACLVRLTVSFKSASLLIRQGFALEAGAVCRLILEQLAWAFTIQASTDDSFFEIEPNRCITNLKALLQSAGRFYGSLSNLAHVHPSKTREYLQFEGSQASVLLSMSHLRWSAAFDLLNLADWFHLVGEHILFEHLEVKNSIRRDPSGMLVVDSNRPFLREILAHAQMARAVGVPIAVDG